MSTKENIQNAKSVKRIKLFVNEPAGDRDAFWLEVQQLNYSNAYYMLRILTPAAIFMLIMSITISDEKSIVFANAVLSAVSAVLLAISFHYPPHKTNRSLRMKKAMVFLIHSLLLFWGMHMLGYHNDNVMFSVDMALVIFLTAFFLLSKFQVILAYFACAITYLFFFTPYMQEGLTYLPVLVTPLLIVISAFFMSRVIFMQFMERFLMSQRLKERQEDLSADLFSAMEALRETEHRINTDIIKTLVKVLEYYDAYTRGHSANVADYAVRIAKEMRFTQEQIDEIMLCGLVHDIGKILIPVHLLNKSSPLTMEEFEVVKRHSQFGFDMLMEAKDLKRIAKIVLHHHERWDGSGYPFGLLKNEIPMESQILMVADAWDAMISERIYKKAKTIEEAKREMIDLKGKQFPPEVVDTFMRCLDNG